MYEYMYIFVYTYVHTEEEKMWQLIQHVMKHCFVYACWTFSLEITILKSKADSAWTKMTNADFKYMIARLQAQMVK